MKNFFKQNNIRKNKKGFTLIELIVVIAIVAVLAAIGIPAIAGQVGKAKQTTLDANAKAIAVQAQLVQSENEAKGIVAVPAAGTTFAKAAGISADSYDASGITITTTAITDGATPAVIIGYSVDTVTVKKGTIIGKWTRV